MYKTETEFKVFAVPGETGYTQAEEHNKPEDSIEMVGLPKHPGKSIAKHDGTWEDEDD